MEKSEYCDNCKNDKCKNPIYGVSDMQYIKPSCYKNLQNAKITNNQAEELTIWKTIIEKSKRSK